MNETEQQIIDVCQELGGIASSNGHFTAYMARLFDNGDEQILSMKVGDLLSLYREANEDFNRVHAA
jgi:hypothetical protein